MQILFCRGEGRVVVTVTFSFLMLCEKKLIKAV